MSVYGFGIGNLELSEWPVNFVDRYYHPPGATISKNYQFTFGSLIVFFQLASTPTFATTPTYPSITISGYNVTTSGGNIGCYTHVLIR